jgi:GntR family transcriptional regulator
MFQIDTFSRIPVYEQIINQLESFVLNDIFESHTQLPSVRGLSVQLSINPNTIQKAYSELDRKGIIYSVPGRGCFISAEAKDILKNISRNKLDSFDVLLNELKLAGVSKSEIVEHVDLVYEKGNSL